ncbi:MAG: SDR family NAD(P)-dependent oxidoreductase [Vicinamibacterales bacterium]
MTRRTALITGASSGIGQAFAGELAARGFDLVVVARREDRLRALAASIEERHGRRVHVFTVDLADPGASARLCEQLAAAGVSVDVLVNNAGFAVPGAFVRSDWPRHAEFLQVMLVAVVELTYRLLPGMIDRGYGRVINVASLAALLPGVAGHTLYAAAKSFLIRFSESLATEVAPRGVHVTAVCPGFTFTEFHDVSGTRDIVSRMPSFMWMTATAVARHGCDAVMAGRRVSVPGRVNSAIATLARLLPPRIVHAMNRRAGSRYRKAD